MTDVRHSIETQLNTPSLRDNLTPLFCRTLHWGRPRGQPRTLAVGVPVSQSLRLVPVAQLGGLPAYRLDWPAERLPNVTQRRAVHRALTPTDQEHVLCYVTQDSRQAAFVWARQRQPGKIELRTLPYEVGSPARTTLEQLAELGFALDELVDGEPPVSLVADRLNRAFDVERVTRAFFSEYHRLFEALEGAVEVRDAETRRLFAQRFFNRLLFVHFLERKGWLRFGGRTDYLRALWQDYQRNEAGRPPANFYMDRLYLLFFAGLNTSPEVHAPNDTFLRPRIGEVPYLNGGLFELAPGDGEVRVPDQTVGTILDDLLYRFNFTVTESTPLEIEVAVDPEMLGKIFEELVTGRHETGSYYTPKPVVEFMCHQALQGYLRRALPEETEEGIRRFVEEHNPGDLDDPRAALQALEAVRVCDPACGSGAYLMGMLHELLELRACLFAHAPAVEKAYGHKLDIIQRNLYGVDIDPFAVNIARLRLWLSLVVDYEGVRPLPLPNLDFKIEAGDSLTAPSPTGSGPQAFRDELVRKFREKKAAYLQTYESGAKQSLLREIAGLRGQIAGWTHGAAPEGSFDWAVEFAEVFASGGFDIILANPPYVRADAQHRHIGDEDSRQQAIARWQEYRRALKGSGIYLTLYEKWDLYIPFLERAWQLLCPGGQMVFIISDAYNRAKYARKSHEFFLANTCIARVDFCSEIPLFAAGVNNTIVHYVRKEPADNYIPGRFRRWGASSGDFEANVEALPTVSQTAFGQNLFRPDGRASGEADGQFVPLERICYVSVGMVIHADERKAHLAFKTGDLISLHQDREHPKPFIEGKDIDRWRPQRIRFLEYGTTRAPALFRRPTFPQLYEVPEKLISKDLSGSQPAVIYDDACLYHNHSAWSFVPWRHLQGVVNRSIDKTARYRRQHPSGDREERERMSREFHLKYLLAIMNSSFARDWLSRRRRSKIHIYPDDWKPLPVAPLPLEAQQEFVRLVDAILAEFAQHGYPLPAEAAARVAMLEREIDERMAELYGVGIDRQPSGGG